MEDDSIPLENHASLGLQFEERHPLQIAVDEKSVYPLFRDLTLLCSFSY